MLKLRDCALVWIGLMAVLLATGCNRRGEYSVQNDTDSKFTDVTASIGAKHRFEHGILSPGAHSSFSGFVAGGNRPLPVEVSWRRPTGELVTNKTSVDAAAFRKEMNVVLSITATGMVVQLKQK